MLCIAVFLFLLTVPVSGFSNSSSVENLSMWPATDWPLWDALRFLVASNEIFYFFSCLSDRFQKSFFLIYCLRLPYPARFCPNSWIWSFSLVTDFYTMSSLASWCDFLVMSFLSAHVRLPLCHVDMERRSDLKPTHARLIIKCKGKAIPVTGREGP
jgi:hypothetical protein